MKKTRKYLIISLTISLITVGIILFYTFKQGLFSEIQEIKTEFFLIALFAHFLSWVVWGFRVDLLSNMTSIKLKYKRSLEIVLSSMFAASLTPSYAGGEPVRIYLLGKEEGGNPGVASAVIFGERTLDFLFLVLAMSFSLFMIGDIFLSKESFVILAISIPSPEADKIKRLVSFFEKPIRKIKPNLSDKVYEEIDNFNQSLWMFLRGGKKILFLGFISTAIFWFLEFSVPYFLIVGLGYNVPYSIAFAGYAVVMISIMIPVSPGGTGVAETVFYFVYNSLIEGFAGVGVLVLLWRFITYYLNLGIGGFISSKILHDLSTIEKEI